ncbi:hypothetical protein LOTGIDRAFT_235459 [Lottia gigantea]|uniref:Uncharacterized protein n=1 Tax=Lottia gigantea TaxID=225164 RepID=V3ZV41_LOTGI|nr:hypothetical protein LOTGIDRAFT_235459 [Lottia gigantea]ESO86430.1 hypothetical protein LOTGIDRAFT_235459 [Lottia gigantea]
MTNKTTCSQKIKPMSENVPIPTAVNVQNGLSNTQTVGYLNSTKRATKYPLSIHSFNKSDSYRQSLLEDIDTIYRNEILAAHGSPTWVAEISKQMTHSGESPLFLQNLLSPHKPDHKSKRPSSARSVVEGKYYRPNRMHQYLSPTELRDHWQGEIDVKYGKPTRTTLLRAQQRAGSVPVNAYDERRKQIENEKKLQASCQSLFTPKESYDVDTDGESQHSFLTGARYNSAHILDSRSLCLYGIYMPRENPERYFVNRKKQDRKYQCPSAPPDSPRSTTNSVSFVKRIRPKTAPNYGRRSSPSPRQAWVQTPTPIQTPRPESYTGIMSPEQQPNIKSLLPSVKGISVSKAAKNMMRLSSEYCTQSPPPSPSGREASNVDDDNRSNKLDEKSNDVPYFITEGKVEYTGEAQNEIYGRSVSLKPMQIIGEEVLVEKPVTPERPGRKGSAQSKNTESQNGHIQDGIKKCPECERLELSSKAPVEHDTHVISRNVSSPLSSHIITIPSDAVINQSTAKEVDDIP